MSKKPIISAKEFAEKFAGEKITIHSKYGGEYVAKIIGWWSANYSYIVISHPSASYYRPEINPEFRPTIPGLWTDPTPFELRALSDGALSNDSWIISKKCSKNIQFVLNIDDCLSEIIEVIKQRKNKLDEK